MSRILEGEFGRKLNSEEHFEPERWQSLRAEILDTFSNSRAEHRIEIAEASAFIKNYGSVRDAVIIDESDISQLEEIIGKHNFLFDVKAYAKSWGFYLGELGIAVANKSNIWKNFDGSDCLSSVLVHELAHGTSNQGVYAGDQDYFPRIGFLDRQSNAQGNFLEEGFADFVRGRFLSKKVGAAGEEKRDFNKNVPFPLKYAYLNRQGILTLGGLSYAGYGMELAAGREPQLVSALKQARRNNEKIEEVQRIMNRIKPGLFESLHELKTGSSDYETGFVLICAAIGIES